MAPSPKKQKKKQEVQKKSRNLLTLSDKLEIIDKRDNGATWAKIAADKNINESVVRYTYGKKDEIKAQGKTGKTFLSINLEKSKISALT